jgi:hypothetical protein
LEDVILSRTRPKSRANLGNTRIVETVVAAAIIMIVFAASTFFITSPQINAVQEKTDLDKLGYNVLNRLAESGTIEATIENVQAPRDAIIPLRAYLHNSLPISIFFNFTVMNWSPEQKNWVNLLPPIDSGGSFSTSLEISSTPIIYTSKTGNIYYLILVLANAGEGTQ